LKNLPEDVKRVIAYLQAKGVHSTKRDLILRLFGPSFTGGEGYRRVSKIIDDALVTELVREDTAGRLYPNVELKMEGDLRAYEPTKEDVAAVVERVMHLIISLDHASKIEKYAFAAAPSIPRRESMSFESSASLASRWSSAGTFLGGFGWFLLTIVRQFLIFPSTNDLAAARDSLYRMWIDGGSSKDERRKLSDEMKRILYTLVHSVGKHSLRG